MPRKIQATYTPAPRLLTVLGDSHTLNYAYNVRQEQFYGAVLAGLLRTAEGVPWTCENWGISGDTTRATTTGGTWTTATVGMQERLACITSRAVPRIAVVYASTNDFSCIASGGAFPAHPGVTTTNVSNNVTRPTVISIINSLVAFGCSRVVVCGYHLRNWSAGGDVTAGVIRSAPSLTVDPGAVFGDSSRWANYQAYLDRVAAHPGKVAFCDLFTFFKSRLELSFPAQIGVDSYLHVGTANTHLNATGEAWVADAVLATIQAQSGWLG